MTRLDSCYSTLLHGGIFETARVGRRDAQNIDVRGYMRHSRLVRAQDTHSGLLWPEQHGQRGDRSHDGDKRRSRHGQKERYTKTHGIPQTQSLHPNERACGYHRKRCISKRTKRPFSKSPKNGLPPAQTSSFVSKQKNQYLLDAFVLTMSQTPTGDSSSHASAKVVVEAPCLIRAEMARAGNSFVFSSNQRAYISTSCSLADVAVYVSGRCS